jgi:AraC family ethanolamine operon transcriptional activator
MARLRMVLQSMFEMLRVRHDLLEQPQIRRSLQDGLLANLFSTLGEAGDTTIAECAQGRRRVVERAKAYVLAKQNEPVTVAELCRAIGASRRKLQYCFHEVLGHSPHQYLRAVRLNRVRRELKGEAAGFVSVQQAAANWGFWHLSHFTADYKAMFGELPSDTLRRSRAAAR